MRPSDLSIKELAAFIGVSTDTIRRAYRKGEIPATRVGTALRFDLRKFRQQMQRNTFATRLVQAGADIYTVQKLGRWKTISMVMRYAHHHPESLRAGIEILARVPAGVSIVLAQSANHAVAVAGSESAASC